MNEFIAWMVASGGIIVLLYPYCLNLRTQRERRLATAVDEFYGYIAPLLNDPNAPAKAIDLLDFLNRQITNRTLARKIFFALLWQRVRPLSRKDPAIVQILAYYVNERQDLLELFMGACVAGIFAISYQSHFFGILLRRLVFFDLNGHRERAPDVVVSLRASGIASNGNHCPEPA